MKSRALHRLLFTGILMAGIAAGTMDRMRAWVATTDLPPLLVATGAEVLDRNGQLLRAYQVADGRWRLAATMADVDPRFIAMLIAFEDKRFYRHQGVDPKAMARAAVQTLWNGRVISGGSTLTMQVARLLENGSTGRWAGKIRQIRVALAIEQQLSKREILNLYLQIAPYGGNLEGIRAASLAYFKKPPRRLTSAEAALLVALPQAPERRRPDRNLDAAAEGRDRVLARMVAKNIIPKDEALAAQTDALPVKRADFPAVSPHLADRMIAELPLNRKQVLTIDATLQTDLEKLAKSAIVGKDAAVSLALMVADYQSGEVLASVGSPAYEQGAALGFIDMTQALRSPGSTLKPLIYGLAFDRGLAHPETLIEDRPTAFGAYFPQNFDNRFRGTIRVRQALQQSLNIPVVSILDRLGPARLMQSLARIGTRPIVPGGKAGLAVGLGGLGMTLADLMRVYGTLARGGVAMDLRYRADQPTTKPARVLSAEAAWQIGDILSGLAKPATAADREIAYKTGTSYGNRDAWALGYDGRYVVGVWMGRPDGTPVPGAFGGDLAAPVLFQIFDHLVATPLPAPPPATLIVANADLPPPLQRFRDRRNLDPTAVLGPAIAFPPDGSLLELAGGTLIAKVRDGQAPFTWLLNGTPISKAARDRQLQVPAPGVGYVSLSVVDGNGQSAQTRFRLK